MATIFPLNTTFTTTPDLVSAEISGEAVMLNLASGIYYGLNTEGARIWALIQEGLSVGSIQQAMLAEYDVLPEKSLADLQELLNQLFDAKLIVVRDEAATENSATS
ncbi:MAG: PqqD family peptide modification chaperone [bacterium]